MNLEEMGALLRQERERLGISIEHAATEIKISKKYLVALEEGRTQDLPHPVYAKGFVKNYARLLKLDPEELGSVLARFYDVDDNHLREAPRYEVKEASPGIRERGVAGFTPSLWLAVPVVLVFVAAIWFFFSSGSQGMFSFDSIKQIFASKSQSGAPAEAPKPEASPAQPSKSAAQKADSSSEAAKSQGADAASVQRDQSSLATSQGGRPQQAQADSGQAGDNPLVQMAVEAQFAATGNQVLEINATQPVKLEATDEAGQTRPFSLVKGQRLSLRFQNRMSVRFVAAPSVSVKLNGKDYPLEGGRADGRSIQFP